MQGEQEHIESVKEAAVKEKRKGRAWRIGPSPRSNPDRDLTPVARPSARCEACEGLAAGDVIQEVGRTEVTTLSGFKDALAQKTDRPVFLRVYRPAQSRSVFIAVPR